jgi:hypothetical protein
MYNGRQKPNGRESIYTVIEWGLEPGVCNDDETSPGLMSEGHLPAVGSAAVSRILYYIVALHSLLNGRSFSLSVTPSVPPSIPKDVAYEIISV